MIEEDVPINFDDQMKREFDLFENLDVRISNKEENGEANDIEKDHFELNNPSILLNPTYSAQQYLDTLFKDKDNDELTPNDFDLPTIESNENFDLEYMKKLLETLCHSSEKHNWQMIEKKNGEEKIQKFYNLLWIKQESSNSYNGVCGCKNKVTFEQKTNMIKIDEKIYNQLQTLFKDMNQKNLKSYFLTLYQQTISEINLRRYIFSRLNILKTNNRMLLEIFEAIFEKIDEKKDSITKLIENQLKDLLLSIAHLILENLKEMEKENQEKESSFETNNFEKIDLDHLRKVFEEEKQNN